MCLLKLISYGKKAWSFNKIALELGMSPSEVHAAAKRTLAARLSIKHENKIRPQIRNLEEFLMHGVQYVFVPERGQLSRGMPTSYACSPLYKAVPFAAVCFKSVSLLIRYLKLSKKHKKVNVIIF